VQLGLFPRVRIVHTSGEAEGQIYVPEINWMLMAACVALVLGFGDSSSLASAYGVAVTGTMTATSVLFLGLARGVWRWSWPAAIGVTAGFLVVDLAFLGANLTKLTHGGWVPLVIAAVVFTVMSTWRRGREVLQRYFGTGSVPVDLFLAD